MNKKLLFATMSLAALTACTNDDFESKNVAQEVSPVQFEVLNNDVATRASMDGNTIKWSAKDGDLFTLYHGAPTVGTPAGYENATYKAVANEGAAATLTTPSMIKAGGAIMVWPVDTTFRFSDPAQDAGTLYISVPAVQTNIENKIPYVSDEITIKPYVEWDNTNATTIKNTQYNVAGKDRKYPVIMRPMASQLIIKADYNGTDAKLAELEAGTDGINPITVESVDLLTKDNTTTPFTTKVPVTFTSPGLATTAGSIKAQWDANVANNNWSNITDFNITGIPAAGQVDQLTTTCVTGTESAKFLILPQATMSTAGSGVADAAVVVNTLYGKVVVAKNGVKGSKYTAGVEDLAPWYRYVSATTAAADGETKAAAPSSNGKYKTVASVELGMKQTLNGFSAYRATEGAIKGEPVGAAATRYVNVLLHHLDMNGLHIKNDKHLRDAARVWKHMGLGDAVVLLDGKNFKISQQTIEVIRQINAAAAAEETPRKFEVAQCNTHVCNEIVITDAAYNNVVPVLDFIVYNDVDKSGNYTPGDIKANVALANETTAWNLNTITAAGVKYGVIVAPAANINKIINRGTLLNAETATLQITELPVAPATIGAQNAVTFENNGTWKINNATINVQFDVTNNGTVNIDKGAQYRQDGRNANAATPNVTVFTNEATTLPERFGKIFTPGFVEQIGKVNNGGVFATVANGEINNYGLIEHGDKTNKDAKTYITRNAKFAAPATDGDFASPFAVANKMGRINLPWNNKEEDNISISAAAEQGFVSVTADGDATEINTTVVGARVNYVIIKSGVETISTLPNTIKYVEINEPGTEIAWSLPAPTATNTTANVATYEGLIVLSDVNIKLNTNIRVNKAAFLGADMYVGGKLFWWDSSLATPAWVDNAQNAAPAAFWNGYYGNTNSYYTTRYITY